MVKKLVLGLVSLVALVLVVSAGVLVWWQTTSFNEAADGALSALVSDDTISVSESEWLAFEPVRQTPRAGFILYPGAQCDHRGYANPLRAIAEQGYLVVSVPMPLNYAILGVDKVREVMAAYPEINTWVLAGHSLGGAMAATFAASDPDAIDGLMFWDSHAYEGADLSQMDLPVAQLYRSATDLPMPPNFQANAQYLPVTADLTPVLGGNHMNFGQFDVAPNFASVMLSDRTIPEPMSMAQQHDLIVAATLDFMDRVVKEK